MIKSQNTKTLKIDSHMVVLKSLRLSPQTISHSVKVKYSRQKSDKIKE
jgi:hypothetical protein